MEVQKKTSVVLILIVIVFSIISTLSIITKISSYEKPHSLEEDTIKEEPAVSGRVILEIKKQDSENKENNIIYTNN